MTIKHVAASLAVLVLVSGCAANSTDSQLSSLRTEVQDTKNAALSAQRASKAAQQAAESAEKSAAQSAQSATRASKDAAQASARAETLYNRSLRKGQ
jgi:Tfp pilus assembly protein PilP